MKPYETPRLKAKGNLSYQDFLRVLEKFWIDAHPGIPLQAAFDKSFGTYPIITYRLDLQKAHPSEPKPRYREEIKTPDGQDAIIIAAQRFQSVITFTIMTQIDPHTAETLVDEFISFMIEMQPVFKEMGVSELVYVRRLPDATDSRPGEGVVSRSVSYMLTTERIIKTTHSKLERVMVSARLYLESPHTIFNTIPSQGTITVNGASYALGDRVVITGSNLPLPPELTAAYYTISDLVLSSGSRQYGLTRIVYEHDQATPGQIYQPITSLSAGSGYISLAPLSEVDIQLIDQ
jgi:hypothetical protein